MFAHTEKLFADAKVGVNNGGNPTQIATSSIDESIIREFQGGYRWLSNFAAVSIATGGYVFPSVENAYMAAKNNDVDWKEYCANETNPAYVKSESRKVKLIDGWDVLKLDVMLELLRIKFSDPSMKAKLLATGNRELQEGNKWGDTFWGVDLRVSPYKGHNNLGKLLMKVRSELQ